VFLTQEKLIKKIQQDRQRGDLKRAQKRAIEGLEKWPDDYDLALEAVQGCFGLGDFQQAVTLLKSMIRHHPRNANRIIDFALDTFSTSYNPFIGSFIIEVLLRKKNFDRVRGMLRQSPRSFIKDLIKRCETRSKSETSGERETASARAENDIMMGLLYLEDEQYEKTVEPLGRAMENSPEDAKQIGSILLEFERDLAGNADVKFYIGLASTLLSHPDKAEMRFFQCLEFDRPPLEKLLRVLDSMEVPSRNHLLLKGEALIRQGNILEGASCIKQHLSLEELNQNDENTVDATGDLAAVKEQVRELTYKRLALLLGKYGAHPEVVLPFADAAAAVGQVKRAVDALETLFHRNKECHVEITRWIESSKSISMSAPAQKLLTRLNLEARDVPKAVEAARMSAEMDPTQIPEILGIIAERGGTASEMDPQLLSIKAELKARAGDTESAEEILKTLRNESLVESDELARLTGEILRHGGITLSGVVSLLETSMETGDVSQVLPYLVEYYREYPDMHGELVANITSLVGHDDARWSTLAELVDALSGEERLTKDFKFLQAHAHLRTGKIEHAVFEYDQLLMLDNDIRYDLLRIYEEAVNRFAGNTTLHLALYQLYLEDEQLADAAHHLCRTLELDPNQIRDVIKRFNDLVKKEPGNRGIWEEMLRSALNMKHFDLARETLKQAIAALPDDEAASLHVYGARLSSVSGNAQDTLRSLAVALTSQDADLSSIERELNDIVVRDPVNSDALYLLGETLFRIGREDEAVSSFEHCLNLSPTYRNNIQTRLKKFLPMSAKPWPVSRILGEIAWHEGRYDEALRLFKTAQEGPPEHLPQISHTLESLMLATPDDQRLKILYTRNLTLEKRYRDVVQYLEKLLAHEKGLTKFAIDILLELVNAEPAQFEANALLARTMIQTGQIERSLDPLLRILGLETVQAAKIDDVVSPFFDTHEDNSTFLIAYARLKSRRRECETAINLYRRALEIDPSRWEKIAENLRADTWPDEHLAAYTLLVADCLITGNNDREAFDTIKRIAGEGIERVDEIIARISSIAQRNPAREYFTFGCSLLIRSGGVDGAAELIGKGRSLLIEPEFEQLQIEFGEMLESHGYTDKAASIFNEILETSSDRKSVLKRIECTFESWTSRELTRGLERAVNGSASPEETERYVRIALDRGDAVSALRMLSGSDMPERLRSALTARTYIYTDRPYLALAVLGSIRHSDTPPDDITAEMLYLEGIASERIGDYGRATAAFSKILGIAENCRDSHSRVALNHTRFLQSTVTDEGLLLEKTGAVSSPQIEGEDSP
jgi:tetratricopeptide (TPR) repeat protein